MPLQETIDTFTYYIKQLVSRDIAYIQLVRYLDPMDPEIDGTFSNFHSYLVFRSALWALNRTHAP